MKTERATYEAYCDEVGIVSVNLASAKLTPLRVDAVKKAVVDDVERVAPRLMNACQSAGSDSPHVATVVVDECHHIVGAQTVVLIYCSYQFVFPIDDDDALSRA